MIGGKEQPGVANSIKTGIEGARVYDIPMGSGILNQEAQTADWEGGFWVLNREKVDGVEQWIVYRRDLKGRRLADSSGISECANRGRTMGGSILFTSPQSLQNPVQGEAYVLTERTMFILSFLETPTRAWTLCEAVAQTDTKNLNQFGGVTDLMGSHWLMCTDLRHLTCCQYSLEPRRTRKDKAAWLSWTSPCLHERRRESFEDALISELFSGYPENQTLEKSSVGRFRIQ